MNKILITGGAGFIGSNLVKALLNRNYSITVLDSLSEQIHGYRPETESPLFLEIKDKVHFIRGSVTDPKIVKKAIGDAEIIVHLAAETGTGQSMYEIARYFDVNVQGTALLLDVLANNHHSIQKVVVASSRAVYGEGKYFSKEFGVVYPETRSVTDMTTGDFEVKYPGCHQSLDLMPTDEASKLHPSSVYGITKQTQEQMIMTICPALGIRPVALRYQNVYGPGQSLSNPYTGILSIFSSRILNGKEINVFEDGKESRDFVYIDDVAKATIAAIENQAADFQIFNVGTGIPVNVQTVAKALCHAYQRQVPIKVSGNFRVGDIRHNFADIKKIRETLGYVPDISFWQGITRFADWVTKQTNLIDGLDRSLEEMKAKGFFK